MRKQLQQLQKTNQAIGLQRMMTSQDPEYYYVRKAYELANDKTKKMKLVNKRKGIKPQK